MKDKLILGYKFKEYYNDNNINNTPYNEIRGIVDNIQIILFCKKNNKEYYKMVDIFSFENRIMNGIYIDIN